MSAIRAVVGLLIMFMISGCSQEEPITRTPEVIVVKMGEPIGVSLRPEEVPHFERAEFRVNGEKEPKIMTILPDTFVYWPKKPGIYNLNVLIYQKGGGMTVTIQTYKVIKK